MNYINTVNEFKDLIINPEIYWQLWAIAICILTAFIFRNIVQHLFRLKLKYDKDLVKSDFNRIIIKYVKPIFVPIITIIILSIGMSIFDKFYNSEFLFSSFIKLILLFLVMRLIKVFFGNRFIANLVMAFLVPIVMLSIFGFLEPIVTYLDSFSFTLGKIRISIYTIIRASLILLIVFWLSGFISRKSKDYIIANIKIKPNTKGILNKVIDIIIYLIVFVVLLLVFGVDTTTFAVIGGAIGVGIGFGLQRIASNFISGIILLFEKSVEIGDLIEIDNGIEGIVTHFGGRYTLLETFDGKEIIVPNESLIINKVTNLTYNNSRGRIEIPVHVAYDSDIKKVKEIMIGAAKEHLKCLLYPSPEVHITRFGENAIELIMYFWINNVSDGRMEPKSDVMLVILRKFKENNIIIPLPQREINLN